MRLKLGVLRYCGSKSIMGLTVDQEVNFIVYLTGGSYLNGYPGVSHVSVHEGAMNTDMSVYMDTHARIRPLKMCLFRRTCP